MAEPRLRVLFIHGKESTPHGTKAKRLAESFDTFGEQMDTSDFEGSVALQAEAIRKHQPDVLVGSSFGGAVLCALLTRGLWNGPSVLLAPATRLYDPNATLPPHVPVVLVHGTSDDVVPVALGRTLARTGTASSTVYYEVDDDHRLTRSVERGDLFDYVQEAYALGRCTLARR